MPHWSRRGDNTTRAIGDRGEAVRTLARRGRVALGAIASRDDALRATLEQLPPTLSTLRDAATILDRTTGQAPPVLASLAAAAGLELLRLETAPWMVEAHRLYESVGFVDRDEYDGREFGGIAAVLQLGRFMELALSPRSRPDAARFGHGERRLTDSADGDLLASRPPWRSVADGAERRSNSGIARWCAVAPRRAAGALPGRRCARRRVRR